MKKYIYFLLFLCCALSITTIAQKKVASKAKPSSLQIVSEGGMFGSIFTDYSYILQEPQPGNVTKGTSGNNAFTLRRVDIGYEYFFNHNVSSRITYNASANALEEASIGIKNIQPLIDVKLGMMKTLSSATVEKIWRFRSLDQSILDRLGYSKEFDAGAELTGRMNTQGTSYATIAVYNGTGTFADTNKLKKIGFSAGNWFSKSSVLELYVDYENVGSGKSVVTGKVFYGTTMSQFTFGVEGFYTMNRKFAGTKDVVPAGGSVFGKFDLAKSFGAVLRVDGYDNDLNQSNIGFREVYVNAGLDYVAAVNVHLIPNIVYKKQLKKGTTVVDAEYMEARLTGSVEF
ncbi:MAG: hypothetical protein WCT99_00230 [Bacteroidota bacterium]|jgi:hypothetical protein